MKDINFRFRFATILVLYLLIAGILESCGPKIFSFNIQPLTIAQDDSVKINWSVRGKPTLLFNVEEAGDERSELRIFNLVVQRSGKEKDSVVFVNVLPQESQDNIVFDAERNGDTLIAKGEKNINRWGDFYKIKTISSASKRDLIVTHMGITVQLKADGTSSSLLKNLSNSGDWEIKTLLTPEEKQMPDKIPSVLKITSIIFHQKTY